MSPRPSSIVSAPTSASASGIDRRRAAAVAAALLVALGAVAACHGDAKRAAPKASTPSADLSAYRLGIGDRVRVNVFGEPELSVEGDVDATGHLSYPLLGSVLAMKKTAAELAADIAKGLAGGYLVNPDVRVAVVQYRAVYVTGQVNRPGAYPYAAGLTVEKALVLAGGLTRLASTRGIYLLREDTPVSQRQRVSLDAVILPGDTLLVEESLF